MTEERTPIQDRLFELQDLAYRTFHCGLMPTVPPENVIGVRMPKIRALAKELNATPEAEAFLKSLPHRYYEENNLHGCLIEKIRDYGAAVGAVDAFLPYVDNWATCDMMSPKVFKKHTAELYPVIERWIASGKTYTVRFGIEMLMNFYLREAFDPCQFDLVASIRSGEYYVNMMIAWYFATALFKQYDAALPILTENRLAGWTHNKTIQKAIESYRITDEQKAYLRTLKR